MRKLLFVLLFLSLALPCWAEVPGFQLVYEDGHKELIPFGTQYDDVFNMLKQKYKRAKLRTLSSSIVISAFEVAGIPYDVFLVFDDDKHFFKYFFKSESFAANKLDPLVYGLGANLTEVFRAKFGSPEKCFSQKPSILRIREGYFTPLCTWEVEGTEIYTAIATIDYKYYATGYVISESISSKIKEEKEEQNKTDIEEAADSF